MAEGSSWHTLSMTKSSQNGHHVKNGTLSSLHVRKKPRASTSHETGAGPTCLTRPPPVTIQKNQNDHKSALCLNVVVPLGRRQEMVRILRPLFRCVQDFGRVLRVVEDVEEISSTSGSSVPRYSVAAGEMNAPSLAVMTFLPEVGRHSYHRMRRKYLKPPWRHHHTIQLETSLSQCVVGKQEFFFLSRQLPLWSTCQSTDDNCKIRLNLFVRRFNAMVEFYRLVTCTEMESSKPDFCIFPLWVDYQESSSDTTTSFELALKHCPHIAPYPPTDAHLVFPVQNISTLRTVLPTDVTDLGSHRFVVCDPDGNTVILHDVTSIVSNGENSNNAYLKEKSTSFETKTRLAGCNPKRTSLHNESLHSESLDSGLFSDLDTCSAELDQCMSRLQLGHV